MNLGVIHGSQKQTFTFFHSAKLDKCNTRSGLHDIFIHINYDTVDYNTFFFFLHRYLPMAKCDLEVRIYYNKTTS